MIPANLDIFSISYDYSLPFFFLIPLILSFFLLFTYLLLMFSFLHQISSPLMLSFPFLLVSASSHGDRTFSFSRHPCMGTEVLSRPVCYSIQIFLQPSNVSLPTRESQPSSLKIKRYQASLLPSSFL